MLSPSACFLAGDANLAPVSFLHHEAPWNLNRDCCSCHLHCLPILTSQVWAPSRAAQCVLTIAFLPLAAAQGLPATHDIPGGR